MEGTKEVVSCSNTGLIQIIPLIFLQEGNKKAPYVQPEESLAKTAVASTPGTVYEGAILRRQFKSTPSLWFHRLDHRPYSSVKEWNQPGPTKAKARLWAGQFVFKRIVRQNKGHGQRSGEGLNSIFLSCHLTLPLPMIHAEKNSNSLALLTSYLHCIDRKQGVN